MSCRAVAEALLAALMQLQAGAAFQPGVIPAQAAAAATPNSSKGSSAMTNQGVTTFTATATAAGAPSAAGVLGSLKAPAPEAASAPVTVRSTGSSAAATDFNLGSDAVSSSWHAGGPVDVASLTQLVQLVLKVLQRMERWRSVMSIGENCGVLSADLAAAVLCWSVALCPAK
jgi:hypothetical protein